MKRVKGFSLIEMQIALGIAAIMAIIIGVISSIAFSGYNRVTNEADVYNQATYAIKLIQNRVHSGKNISTITLNNPTSGSWVNLYYSDLVTPRTNPGFLVDGKVFAVYNTGVGERRLVYLNNTTETNPNNFEVFFSIPVQPVGTTDPNLRMGVTITGSDEIDITLGGEKPVGGQVWGMQRVRIPFNIKTKILKRGT